jgi:hypothetical protein
MAVEFCPPDEGGGDATLADAGVVVYEPLGSVVFVVRNPHIEKLVVPHKLYRLNRLPSGTVSI